VPTATIDFTSFGSSGSGAAWSGENNAGSSNDSWATATVAGLTNETKLLRCSGADFSAIPANAVVTEVRAKIEAQGNGARLNLVRGWDGSGPVGQNLITSDTQGVLGSSDSTFTFGVDKAGWLFWNRNRMADSAQGIVLSAILRSGFVSATVKIDHVYLEVDYVVLVNGFPVVDLRPVLIFRPAGQSGTTQQNSVGEQYQP
jgi:hypothetical protein